MARGDDGVAAAGASSAPVTHLPIDRKSVAIFWNPIGCQPWSLQYRMRVNSFFVRRFNVIWVVQSPCQKYFDCAVRQITSRTLPVSPERAALAIVTNVGRDAVDALASQDERGLRRAAKPSGPDAPTLASSWRSDPQAMVAIKPGHQGERGISRKPLRREGRIVSANLWRLRSCVFLLSARVWVHAEYPVF